jgi:CDP-diacylglycerol--glycerol-3-phosphate 3-phosphatidyltransferase
MVSYTRARAENTIPQCKVGFMERPERIVLVIIGALFNRMAAILWVIAVLGNITVIHRIAYTYQVTEKKQLGLGETEAEASQTIPPQTEVGVR